MSGDLTIICEPQDVRVLINKEAKFTVEVLGSKPVYTWYRNGAAIPGATKRTYRIDSVQESDNGAQFYCVITNNSCSGGGMVTTRTATLTVSTCAPSVTRQPVSQTVVAGCKAKFTIEVDSPCCDVQYTWYVNGVSVCASGKRGNTLIVETNSASPASSSIYCVATNSYGTVTSNTVTLTVTNGTTPPIGILPVITTQPTSVSANVGAKPTLAVIASNATSYQWMVQSMGSGSPVAVVGATSSTYTVLPLMSTNDGDVYTVVVSNSAGSVTSNSAVVRVVSNPVISQQPVDQAILVGQSAVFSVMASGTSPINYQWYVANPTTGESAPISGANTPSYTTPIMSSMMPSTPYYCVVTNPMGSVTSNRAYLSVGLIGSAPIVTSPPRSTTVQVNSQAVFSVSVTGAAPITYRWFVGGIEQVGVNSSTLTYGPVTTADTNKNVYVIATNSYGTATSASAVLTVSSTNDPSFTTQPSSVTVKSGAGISFTAVAQGTQPITYQWYNQNGPISGATSSTYTISRATTANNGWRLFATATNTQGMATSATATLTVKRDFTWLWVLLGALAFIILLVVILVLIFAPKRKTVVIDQRPTQAPVPPQRPAPAPQQAPLAQDQVQINTRRATKIVTSGGQVV